jgi:hypothetical protein
MKGNTMKSIIGCLILCGVLALAETAEIPAIRAGHTNDLRPLLMQVLRGDDSLKIVMSRQQENRLFGWVNVAPRTNMPVDLTVEITAAKTLTDAIAEMERFKGISHVAPTKSVSGLGDEAVLYTGVDGKRSVLLLRAGTNTVRIAGKPPLVEFVGRNAAKEFSGVQKTP